MVLCGSMHYVKDVRPQFRPLLRGLKLSRGLRVNVLRGRSGMQAPPEGGAPVPPVFATHGTGLQREMSKRSVTRGDM